MSVAFCRYLLDKQHIDPLVFLEAVDQLRAATPTLPRLLWQHNLLDAKAMMEVFAHQALHHLSFEASCRSLGFWTPKLEASLDQILAASHQSIFHILVGRGLINCHDLIKNLDEFISIQKKEASA